LAVVIRSMRSRPAAGDATAVPLTAEEQLALDRLLKARQADGTAD
jgi:hypothetical protein